MFKGGKKFIRLFVALSGSFSCPEPWRENSQPLEHCGEKTHSKARRFLPPLVPTGPPGFLFLQTIFFSAVKVWGWFFGLSFFSFPHRSHTRNSGWEFLRAALRCNTGTRPGERRGCPGNVGTELPPPRAAFGHPGGKIGRRNRIRQKEESERFQKGC